MGRLSWVFVVSITGGYPEKEILAIRADGAGDVTKSHIIWRSSRGVASETASRGMASLWTGMNVLVVGLSQALPARAWGWLGEFFGTFADLPTTILLLYSFEPSKE